MKKTLIVLFLTGWLFNLAQAQKPAYEMTVDGVKVIVQPSGNDIVEVQTVLKGGVQNYAADKTGIESLAMSALTECGTKNDDKNSFKNKLDKVSAQVYGYTSKDYAVFRMNCIKGDFNTVWPLYVDALTQPRFDEKEFARVKQDAINNLKAQNSRPDAAINKFAEQVAFAGRDYAKDPMGTVESLQSFTAAATKAYYQSILTRSRMLVVVVADLDKSEIENKVKAMLDGIKPGASFTLKKSSFRIYKNTFTATPKELATNYIEGITSGPQPGTPDFDAFQVAMRIFYDKHFLDVRTNNGLSYAPSAYFSGGATASARFVVSTTQPDAYIKVFDQLVERIKKEGFNAAEVKDMKTTFLTSFYYKQETNSAQASSIAANEVLHDNWKRSLTLADDVKKLTPDEVNTAFRRYVGNISWVYQGDPKKVDQILYINGTIKRPDNPVNH
ncbi:pitrilysin family protein [uncultured Mucilaginibacter sp.]|uniref:M16 family metallopeptidase n=1 Tax=uncultured Mucilaginibacter sp. TaxID=797541 RepID=UPI00261071C7|nr:pitrilysin family protein [uncultured Mucilaginibacter sp.]